MCVSLFRTSNELPFRIVPIKLIAFYIVGFGFRADFFVFYSRLDPHSRKVMFHTWNIKQQEPNLVLLVLPVLPF